MRESEEELKAYDPRLENLIPIKKIAQLDPSRADLKWRGSINYLTKYVDLAIKKIEAGPR